MHSNDGRGEGIHARMVGYTHTHTHSHTHAGETVFLVTHYHQFSDLTNLSAHQATCNYLSLLEVHSKKHKWIDSVWRQTDNCHTYESKKSCLSNTQVRMITNVQPLGNNNNEPNHGGGEADRSGANMKDALWCWTHKNGRAIQQARFNIMSMPPYTHTHTHTHHGQNT